MESVAIGMNAISMNTFGGLFSKIDLNRAIIGYKPFCPGCNSGLFRGGLAIATEEAMIEEVLKKVSLSEETAKGIREESEEKASLIRAAADKNAAEIIENGASDSRVKRLSEVQNAKMNAAAHFETEKKAYSTEAERFKAEKSGKVEQLAEELFGRIKNGDC